MKFDDDDDDDMSVIVTLHVVIQLNKEDRLDCMEQQQLQQHQLQHFIHPYHHHPLLFNPDDDKQWRL